MPPGVAQRSHEQPPQWAWVGGGNGLKDEQEGRKWKEGLRIKDYF